MLDNNQCLPYINTTARRAATHPESNMTQQPTITIILADAKKAGLVVTKSASKVNGATAYKVEGKPGLFSKTGLMQLIGVYG